MLDAAVDGLGGAVAGAGSVELGRDVAGALLQGLGEATKLGQRGWDAGAEGGDDTLICEEPGRPPEAVSLQLMQEYSALVVPCSRHLDNWAK